MIIQMQQSIKSCVYGLQHEGNLPKVPLHLTVATTPLDLLHIDFHQHRDNHGVKPTA